MTLEQRNDDAVFAAGRFTEAVLRGSHLGEWGTVTDARVAWLAAVAPEDDK